MKHSTLILLICSLAAVAWVVQKRHLQGQRASLQATRSELAVLQERIQQAESALTAEADQRRQAQRERDAVVARTVTVEAELAREDPEHYWVEPPANWPSWEPASPYVWLPKEEFGRLRAPVFGKDGRLHAGVPGVLVLDKEKVVRVNAALPSIVDELRALELSRAVQVEEPLPGIVKDGPHLTIEVPFLSEDANRLRTQFESVLRESFGEQRAGMLLESGAGWMREQFPTAEEGSKVYSMVRHPDGTYNISIRGPGSSMSVGGGVDPALYIPPHLLPLFSDIAAPVPIEQASQSR